MAAPTTVVARVGTQGITEQQVDARAAELEQSYRVKAGRDLSAAMRLSIRRQALEALVRVELFKLESARLASTVPDADAEAIVKRAPVFNPGGQFSAHAYANAQRNQPAKMRAAVMEVKKELAAQRFAEQMRQRSTPSDEDLRGAARRELETADADVMIVPRTWFTGRYREPTEREVLEEYRQHAKDLEDPAHAIVTAIAIVPAPGADPAAFQARVAGAIASLKQGVEPSVVADRANGSRKRLSLREDNYPGSWHGSPSVDDAIFHAAPGTVLDEAVPADQGVYVVRVEEGHPRHRLSLAESSPEVRESLRNELKMREDEKGLRGLYDAARDSLARPGYKLRVAILDRAKVTVPQPTAAELEEFYQAHLADYTRYDAASGALVSTPLAAIRDTLVRRYKESRRDLVVHDAANRLVDAWTRGTRDRATEATATVRDLGTVPYGSRVDVGAASDAVTDTLKRRIYDRRIEIVPYDGGYAVADAYDLVERVVPTLDQVRVALLDQLTSREDDAEVARARQMYERDPDRFLTGTLIYYTRMWLRQPELIDVPLTREEIASYYRAHLSQYAAPERFRVRHILVKAPAHDVAGDERARQRAEDLLKRVRAGEDFGDLARRLSEDDHTRDDGGDLSYRARGELDPPLEDAAFKLKVGQVSGVVRATDGYHLLQVTEHVPEQAEPLAWVYTAVGADCALEKSERIARHMADSLFQTIRTPEQARAVAARLHLQLEQFHQTPGDRNVPPERLAMVQRLERLKANQMYPGTEYFLGQGAAVMWVDSIAAPHLPLWDQAVGPVMAEYRRRMGDAALRAKQAELDSLLRSGWSLDSLAALWGGTMHLDKLARRQGLPPYGGAALVDSLVFGDPSGTPLATRAVSDWFELPDAIARLRVNARHVPTDAEIQERIGQDRGLVQEYRLQDQLKAMKQRYPVTILDQTLREATLPPLPPMPEL